jgi:hypothetical protein
MKRTGPGSEVDAWCTKCKLDLGHRIIAMEGDRIARVECLTCRGHHNYRRPHSDERAPVVRKKSDGAPKSSAGRRPPKKGELKQLWEDAIMGRSPEDFVSYRIDVQLLPGQLVRHKKFGDGVVSELIEGDKVQVIFEDGPRTLIHGR